MDATPQASASTPPVRHPGRPRRAATDAAIVRAAVELMTEVGAAGTTLAAVARRAGVARATVYLRWPTRSALIGAASRAAVGGRPLPMTGDLERDVRQAVTFVQQAFESPTFVAILPEVVRAVLASPPEVSFDAIAPRRRDFARLYAEQAADAGFDPGIEPNLAFDVVLGTAIARLLANRRSMTDAEARQLADVVVRGLRAEPARA